MKKFNNLLEYRIYMNGVLKDIIETSKAKTIGLVGVRGNTKTYLIHKLMYESFIDGFSGAEYFRTMEDIKAKKDSFFVNHDQLLVEDLKIDTYGIYTLVNKVKKYKMLFIPITRANRYKSNSVPNVKYMFIDEFIPEDNVYVDNEAFKVAGIIKTVNRDNPQAKVLLASNSVKTENLYFLLFDVKVEDFIPYEVDTGLDIEMWRSKKGDVEFYKLPAPPDYEDLVKDSVDYSWGQYTGYNAFANDNEFMLDDKEFVVKLDVPKEELTFQYHLVIQKNVYSLVHYDRYYVFIPYDESYDGDYYEVKSLKNMSRSSMYKPLGISLAKKQKALYLQNRLLFSEEHIKDELLPYLENGYFK